MRLASFRGPDGDPARRCRRRRGGDERIVDLVEATGGSVPAGDLLALLEAGPAALAAARAAVGRRCRRPAAERSSSSCAPIRRPGKLLAVAGNFQAHIEEGGGQRVDKTKIVPKLFIKPSSAIIGPGEAVALPERLERARLGARARHRHRDARPRHPARQGPRPHRRVLGDQRHLRPLACSGASRAVSRRLRRLLRLAQWQVGRRVRGPGPVDHHDRLGARPTRTSSR